MSQQILILAVGPVISECAFLATLLHKQPSLRSSLKSLRETLGILAFILVLVTFYKEYFTSIYITNYLYDTTTNKSL